jgi:tRNA nucleotidyltransferase (CCA-adding enzyme)
MDPIAGLDLYLVGGAVRDELLGLPIHERDWVVVGATPAEMLARGFRPADVEFPVFLHPESGEEYALARTERKQGSGYRGFEVDASPDVTLREDLARRDLTINAMARGADGGIVDPFNGQADLEDGVLRHVTPAFEEDPLRMLRVARFAARLGRWGFRLAHGTHGLLKRMAASGDLAALTPERVWRETSAALAADQPWRYFEVLHRCGGLARLLPEIDAAMGGDRVGHGQPQDGGPSLVLRRVAGQSPRPELRFAALMGAVLPAARLAEWCREHRCQRRYQEQAQQLLDNLGGLAQLHGGDEHALFQLISRLRCDRFPERCQAFLIGAGALQPEFGAGLADNLRIALAAWHSLQPADLQRQGLSGKALGQALAAARLGRIREQLVQHPLTHL